MKTFRQVGPSTWRFVDDSPPPARSELPCPNIISDTMDPVEQVDGRFYDSKSQFRAVGRSLGLREVGNEKLQPKTRGSVDPVFKHKRKAKIKEAIEKVRAGHYERYFHPDGSRRAVSTDPGDDT